MACAATRLSTAGTKSAVRVLHAVARHSATPAVLQEMLVVGVGARLLFLVQVGASGEQTRARVRWTMSRSRSARAAAMGALACEMDLDRTHEYIIQQRARTLAILAAVLAIIRWRIFMYEQVENM